MLWGQKMSEKINVLHVVGRMDRGGTETLLMNLLRTVDRSVFQFDFVEQTNNPCDYDEEIKSLGSRIYRCPTISPLNLREYRLWWRDFFRKHPEYHIVHGHSRGSAPIYLDEANKAGRVTIAHCHSNSHGKGVRGLIRYVWQLPLRKIANYNFACSYEAGMSQYRKESAFKVINNGIISSKFTWNSEIRNNVRRQLGIENNFVVGNVARFDEPKNHEFLIKVFAELTKRVPESRLLLVGKGPLLSHIQKEASELGINDKVMYLGLRNDVNELLQAMDILVFPSKYEGTPLALVEAQASGLPCYVSADVISKDVDITDLIHHISLNESPEYWADYILEHQISINDRRDTSQEIINAGFDIRSTADELCSFYREILND